MVIHRLCNCGTISTTTKPRGIPVLITKRVTALISEACSIATGVLGPFDVHFHLSIIFEYCLAARGTLSAHI